MLAELLQSRPNFLVLDEPTNHMDIQAKETLESAFRAYKGTILFVSHDRYLIRQVADAVMIFENQTVMYYPFGYEHYLERKARENQGGSMAAQIRAEEQALIAGMRAVPKAERHRLREIPEDEAYRESVLPANVSARVAVEAGIADYWYKYVGLKGAIVGMRGYGESAPADKLFPYFGFTVENVVEKALSVL